MEGVIISRTGVKHSVLPVTWGFFGGGRKTRRLSFSRELHLLEAPRLWGPPARESGQYKE